MNAVRAIALWGIIALSAALAGGLLAAAKNRDHSWWAAWCFVVPPMLIVLLLLGRHKGPRPRRPSLEDEDRGRDWI